MNEKKVKLKIKYKQKSVLMPKRPSTREKTIRRHMRTRGKVKNNGDVEK